MPEPDLMLDEAQARAYAAADFAEPHDRFVTLLRAKLHDLPPRGTAVDLGCGPGDVTFRLARALPGWSIDALDGSPAMLALGRQAAARRGVETRVRFHQAVLPQDAPPRTAYDLVVSNSLLHHLADPGLLWSSAIRWGGAGAPVFVMDLMRPASDAEARALVERWAASEPEVLRTDNSLRAAYRPAEVRTQLVAAGIAQLAVEVVSDRHFIVWGRLDG